MTNLFCNYRVRRKCILILGLCVMVLAVLADFSLAVDPDMQALVIDNSSGSPVPEPATALLFATGIVGFALHKWRNRKK